MYRYHHTYPKRNNNQTDTEWNSLSKKIKQRQTCSLWKSFPNKNLNQMRSFDFFISNDCSCFILVSTPFSSVFFYWQMFARVVKNKWNNKQTNTVLLFSTICVCVWLFAVSAWWTQPRPSPRTPFDYRLEVELDWRSQTSLLARPGWLLSREFCAVEPSCCCDSLRWRFLYQTFHKCGEKKLQKQ